MQDYNVDFPTLWIVPSWIEAHTVIPDGDRKGEPFILTNWQLWCVVNHYRVKQEAKPNTGATAFANRRSQIIMPQKAGKSPTACAFILAEALGPVLFDGWAKGGEVYDCQDYGCRCGWEYSYEPGEPMGRPWATPLIQLTAVSVDQVDNTYSALRPMVSGSALKDLVQVTEEFIRLPNDGRIDVVSSNARSRLGQRVTFVVQDESSLWTPTTAMVKVAETQRRGLAGMGGRAIETTNAFDPSENSVAQRTAESRAEDLFRFHPLPPKNLSYDNKRDRRKIHQFLYSDSPWVHIDAIDAEAAELYEVDPSQAKRFFGNIVEAGSGMAYDPRDWEQLTRTGYMPKRRAKIAIGLDGALREDALAIIATEIDTGFQWPITIMEVPSLADNEYQHDLELAEALVDQAFADYEVFRMYCDPQRVESLVVKLQGKYGADRVINWTTNRPRQMAYAIRAHQEAIGRGEITHNGDKDFARHIANAVKRPVNVYDDNNQRMFLLYKDRPHSPRKIDAAIASILSWEARSDAIAKGSQKRRRSKKMLVL